MPTFAAVLLVLHLVSLSGLAVLSVHRLVLMWASRRGPVRPPERAQGAMPHVTVQLPIFNERAVATRVIDAVAALRWPSERLEIQVLDDSTDETVALVDAAVASWVERGVDAKVLRRTDRAGFKAGALAAGLEQARGQVIAIFDADFVPQPDTLERLVPFLSDGVGMVQARWGHLNAEESWLTRVQATMLDGHFILEHGGRWRLGAFFNFNGTAGVWRAQAIRDAGGWSHDTLTEDMDLSYRAQLAGWRFTYLDDVVVPAELPATVRAFKAQQARWARGGVQTMRKLLGTVWRAPVPGIVKREATSHLLANAGYPLTLWLALLLPALPWARELAVWHIPVWVDVSMFLVCVAPLFVAYGDAITRSGHGHPVRRLFGMPVVLAVSIGMSATQTLAVWRGFGRDVGVFERTPKRGGGTWVPYGVRTHGSWLVELGLASWQLVGVGTAWTLGGRGGAIFPVLFFAGFAIVGGRTAWEALNTGRRSPAPGPSSGLRGSDATDGAIRPG